MGVFLKGFRIDSCHSSGFMVEAMIHASMEFIKLLNHHSSAYANSLMRRGICKVIVVSIRPRHGTFTCPLLNLCACIGIQCDCMLSVNIIVHVRWRKLHCEENK